MSYTHKSVADGMRSIQRKHLYANPEYLPIVSPASQGKQILYDMPFFRIEG